MQIAFELSDKLESQPALAKVDLIAAHGFNHVHLTNKQKIADNSTLFAAIKSNYPEMQITPTFSVLNHYSYDIHNIVRKFLDYSANLNASNYLLVSGPTPRKYNTVSLLPCLQKFQLSVAYNPFLPDLVIENFRLEKKLRYTNVKRVYIQIGLDAQVLTNAINWVRSIRPDVQIYVCLLFPTTNVLSKWHIRPWKGVYLSEEFLSSAEIATSISLDLVKICQQLNVNVLVTAFDNLADLLSTLK